MQMKMRFVQLVVMGMLVAAGATTAAAQGVKSDQQTLMDLERQWDSAFRNRDVKFIESILEPDFIATYEDGSRADKAKELALAGAFDQQIDDSELDDFTIKINGDTAVVWFTLHLLGPVQGKSVEIAYNYIDVWVLRNGQWKCIGSQSTRLRPKDTQAK
jgi:ketosteroid isomerase-like protein